MVIDRKTKVFYQSASSTHHPLTMKYHIQTLENMDNFHISRGSNDEIHHHLQYPCTASGPTVRRTGSQNFKVDLVVATPTISGANISNYKLYLHWTGSITKPCCIHVRHQIPERHFNLRYNTRKRLSDKGKHSCIYSKGPSKNCNIPTILWESPAHDYLMWRRSIQDGIGNLKIMYQKQRNQE